MIPAPGVGPGAYIHGPDEVSWKTPMPELEVGQRWLCWDWNSRRGEGSRQTRVVTIDYRTAGGDWAIKDDTQISFNPNHHGHWFIVRLP